MHEHAHQAFIHIIAFILGTTGDYFDTKRRLMRYLTNDSEIVREIRPARDNNTSVNIKVRIHLREIANVVSSLTST